MLEEEFWLVPIGGFSVNGQEVAQTGSTAVLDTGENVFLLRMASLTCSRDDTISSASRSVRLSKRSRID